MKFKQAQKFRVIVNGVSVYTTAKQIRWGFGDLCARDHALQNTLGYPPRSHRFPRRLESNPIADILSA